MSSISLTPNQQWLVGVDLGGTTVTTLVVDRQFVPYSQLTVPTDLTSPEETLAGIHHAIEQTLALAGVGLEAVAAVGLGVPGRLDRSKGVVNLAVNLNFKDFPLIPLLSEKLGLPCFLENDVRSAAWGVYRFDNEAGVDNLIYVGLGTGLAAGIILNGQLYRGVHELAGEIGHIIVEPDGPRCKCGAQGCLETLVAGPAIAELGQQAARSKANSLLSREPVITAQTVYQAAQRGDPAALSVTHRVGRYLGRALQGLVMSFDIEEIVLGGGVARAGQAFLQPILREWAHQRQKSTLAQEVLDFEILRLADPERNMGAWGAVALAAQALSRP